VTRWSAIRRMHVAVLASVGLVAPLWAQPLSENWQVLGTFEVSVDAEELALHAVADSATGAATLSRDSHGEYEVIQITGLVPGPGGEPGVPILTVTLGPYLGDVPEEITLEYREADRVLMASIDSETEAVLHEVTISPEGEIAFSFEGELAVMTPLPEGGFEPTAGAMAVAISGRFSGVLPEE